MELIFVKVGSLVRYHGRWMSVLVRVVFVIELAHETLHFLRKSFRSSFSRELLLAEGGTGISLLANYKEMDGAACIAFTISHRRRGC